MNQSEQEKLYAKRRRAVLRAAQKQHDINALLITDQINTRYLTGATEGAMLTLITPKQTFIMTRKMFADKLPYEALGCNVIIEDNIPAPKVLKKLIKEAGIQHLGFEEDRTTLSAYRALTDEINPKNLISYKDLVMMQRAIKDEHEIKLIRKAIRISQRALKDMMNQGQSFFIGKSEKQLAAELEYRMRMLGADRQGFPFNGIIVGAGPNSASAHHFPTNRKVKKGDMILFDWGAEVDGYRSDMTRVLFMGKVHPQIAEIYPVVEQAMKDAIAALKPGVNVKTVDAVSRKIIDQSGHGPKFRHGLGHGFGLEIHEQPFLSKTRNMRLKKNMVVTIEPGIYFDGLGGVRLENDVLITADGHKDLSSLPTRLDKMIIN